MNRIKWVIVYLLLPAVVVSEPPVLSQKELKNHPPRIIRTCCTFGSDIKLAIVPFAHLNQVIDFKDLGTHSYLGGKDEGNGILYTKKGGFIDLGHLREWADWTAFLYLYLENIPSDSTLSKVLGIEGGKKVLELNKTNTLSPNDKITLAGKIAFDLSIWHEIATGFGVSPAPFITEKFSSFSVEDIYSNLLGIQLGTAAIKSDLPYEEAMTNLINQQLTDLKVVSHIDSSYAAMEEVESNWWSRNYSLPNKKLTLKRQYTTNWQINPWLIPSQKNLIEPFILESDFVMDSGENVDSYYTLNIRVNRKIPIKKVLPYTSRRTISQNDFNMLTRHIQEKLNFVD